ncbi:MAG: site-specific integrase [Planctomycetia bacterium]|nr:site-specific integrase [Planctomycetia bacterium]
MPAKSFPAYPRKPHKSGHARIKLDGRNHWFGPHGSAESIEKYEALKLEWLARQDGTGAKLTVDELCLLYMAHAESYYVKPDGTPTNEAATIRGALRFAIRLFGTTRVREFGPKRLRDVQQAMIKAGLVRGTINRHIDRIRRMFRWGVAQECVPVAIHQALATVSGLRRGRSEAGESEPVRPVSDALVEETLEHVTAVVKAMVHFQRLTGCRPGEVCIVRPRDVERSGDVWWYTPESHKTQHHGRERRIAVGPKAQAILAPYLLRAADTYCFSAAESAKQAREARHAKRKTPLNQGNRPGKVHTPNPKRPPRARFTVASYRRAIRSACADAAGLIRPNRPKDTNDANAMKEYHQTLKEYNAALRLVSWHPHQLRHTAATEIRRRFGLEAAQVTLGHTEASVTQIYAERDMSLAARVMGEVG